jgi:hypothetical protein
MAIEGLNNTYSIPPAKQERESVGMDKKKKHRKRGKKEKKGQGEKQGDNERKVDIRI